MAMPFLGANKCTALRLCCVLFLHKSYANSLQSKWLVHHYPVLFHEKHVQVTANLKDSSGKECMQSAFQFHAFLCIFHIPKFFM